MSLRYVFLAALVVCVSSAPVSDKCQQVSLKSTSALQSTKCSSGQLFWGSPKGVVKVRFQGIKEPLCIKLGDNAGPDVLSVGQKLGRKNVPVTFDSEGVSCVKPKAKRVILYIKGPAKKSKIPSTINFAIESEKSNLDAASIQPVKTKDSSKTKSLPQTTDKKKDSSNKSNKSYPTIEDRLGIDIDSSMENVFSRFGSFVWGILSKIFH